RLPTEGDCDIDDPRPAPRAFESAGDGRELHSPTHACRQLPGSDFPGVTTLAAPDEVQVVAIEIIEVLDRARRQHRRGFPESCPIVRGSLRASPCRVEASRLLDD